MKTDLFAELAIVTEQLMAQRSINFDSADMLCNETLLETTGGIYEVEESKVFDVVAEVRAHLNLSEDKGGAR